MNPYLTDSLVRLHQEELLASAQRHRELSAVRRPRTARRTWRLLPTFRQTPAPGCS